MNGAATNPEVHSFAYAGAQVKKMLEITHRLGGENFVFWGGREGKLNSLLKSFYSNYLELRFIFKRISNTFEY